MQLYFKEGTNEPVQWNSYGVWLDIDVGLNSWILDFKDEMVPCFILVGAMEWFSSLFGSRDGMECLFHLPSHEDHATAPALTSLRLCSSPRAELAPPSYPTAHTQPKRRGVICSSFFLFSFLSLVSPLYFLLVLLLSSTSSSEFMSELTGPLLIALETFAHHGARHRWTRIARLTRFCKIEPSWI